MQTQDQAFQDFITDGCGRCSLYKTEQCKAVRFASLISTLRSIVLECGLTETIKWSQPCYTHQEKNVAIVSAMKEYAFIAFFKGVLLQDELGKLIAPGDHSHASRQLRYTNIQEVEADRDVIKAYLIEAMDIEERGVKIETKSTTPDLPPELESMFEQDPVFQAAFNDLTPGRQRGYLIFFNQAKRPETRKSRIEKYIPQIMIGNGMHDEYRNKKKK